MNYHIKNNFVVKQQLSYIIFHHILESTHKNHCSLYVQLSYCDQWQSNCYYDEKPERHCVCFIGVHKTLVVAEEATMEWDCQPVYQQDWYCDFKTKIIFKN